MTRKQIYNFVKSGVDSLKKQHAFGRGRRSELSSLNKDYPVVWFATQPENAHVNTELTANSLPIDGWPIVLYILMLDREDSKPDEYEYLIDQCDEVAQTLQFKYNSVVAGNNLLTISDISRTPQIKILADSATGVMLSFTLSGPDTTDQSENC